jgi:tetratricopeptide (TPR) repeat protein
VLARGVAVLWLAACSVSAQDFAALYRSAEEARRAGGDPAAVRAAYAAAVAAFARVLAPARAATLPAAAFAALQAGDAARAATWIAESVAHGADDAMHAEIQVQALALSGQARAAVDAVFTWTRQHADAVVRALRAVQGQAAGALCEAAETALRQGQTEVGLTTFTQLAAAAERHPVALGNLALALRHVGRVDEAEAIYREALGKAPEDADLWNDLGLLCKGQRRDAEATAAFHKSLACETQRPPSGPATSNLVTMVRAGRAGAYADQLPETTAALAGVLARFPQAGMARHLLLAEVLDAAFPAARTDSRAKKR